MTGGCLFSKTPTLSRFICRAFRLANLQSIAIADLKEDPNETRNLATELPDVLESLKARYMELKADGIDQRTPLSKMAAATKRLTPNYVKMLHENKGFVGPWCSDGACAPVAADSIKMDMAKQEGNFIQPPCKSSLSSVCGFGRLR